MAEELLKQVLGHALISQVLRHRMTQQVRVDVLGDPRLGRNLLYKLLKAPRGVVATTWGGEDVAALTTAQVEPQLVGQAPEDGDVSSLISFVGDQGITKIRA